MITIFWWPHLLRRQRRTLSWSFPPVLPLRSCDHSQHGSVTLVTHWLPLLITTLVTTMCQPFPSGERCSWFDHRPDEHIKYILVFFAFEWFGIPMMDTVFQWWYSFANRIFQKDRWNRMELGLFCLSGNTTRCLQGAVYSRDLKRGFSAKFSADMWMEAFSAMDSTSVVAGLKGCGRAGSAFLFHSHYSFSATCAFQEGRC